MRTEPSLSDTVFKNLTENILASRLRPDTISVYCIPIRDTPITGINIPLLQGKLD